LAIALRDQPLKLLFAVAFKASSAKPAALNSHLRLAAVPAFKLIAAVMLVTRTKPASIAHFPIVASSF
jgi:hypothetical protein